MGGPRRAGSLSATLDHPDPAGGKVTHESVFSAAPGVLVAMPQLLEKFPSLSRHHA